MIEKKKLLPRRKVEELIRELTEEEIIAPAVRFFLKWYDYADCQSVFNLRTRKVEEICLDKPEKYEQGYIFFDIFPYLYRYLNAEMIFTFEERAHIEEKYGFDWQKKYPIEEICFNEKIDLYERLVRYLINSVDLEELYVNVDEQLDKIYNREQNESDINLEDN